MKNISAPKISVEDVMRKIREVVDGTENDSSCIKTTQNSMFLSRIADQPKFEYKQDGIYALEDFLKYHDEEFVINAYRGILNREPDEQGYANFLSKLRQAELNKIQILRNLRYSQEGKHKNVTVKGLTRPSRIRSIYGIPILGYALRLISNIMYLPRIMHSIREFEAFTNARFTLYSKNMNNVSSEIEKQLNKLMQDYHKLQLSHDKLQLSFEEVKSSLNKLITDQDKKPFNEMYMAFEERFRGSRGDIKNRVKIYLPYIIKAKAGFIEAPILDVGCGRGEWLELLKENNLVAKGIDINEAMVKQCRECNIEAIESDLMSYLEALDSNSLGAITGFHIIEHLPLKTLIELFDEAYRVLKPGGIVIFETPNPENILVGASSFYSDPTHVRPLVPETLRFIAEQRGFTNTEILRANTRDEPSYQGDKYIDEVVYKMNMEQDYSIIGYKSMN